MSPVEKAVLEGLNKGIQQELAAYVFYKKGMEIVKDEKVKEILTTLASEEKDHYRILEAQYDNLVRSEMWNTYTDILRKEGLPDIDEHMTGFQHELIDEVSETTSPLRMLEIGFILETQAHELYSSLAETVGDPKGKEMYLYLAKFEQGHANKIKRMMADYQ